MKKCIEKKLVNFWMNILPELAFDNKKLNEHLNKFLSINTTQAIQSYFNYVIPEVNALIKGEHDCIEEIKDQLFSSFFQQFIFIYESKLASIIQQTTLISDKVEFRNVIHRDLYKRLFGQGYLVLIKELNLYRQNHLLEGKTDEEQFDYFCSKLIVSKEFLKNVEQEYPAFLKGLVRVVETTILFIQEIIENTEKHIEELERFFPFRIKESLKEIKFMGDLHNGGKSVCKLIFESGALIYKPRPMKIESKFQELLEYINKNISGDKLHPIKVFTKEDYGWAEFVPHIKCRTQEEIIRCYQRTGKLLALLYSLNGVDFHYENVIFKGEFPVLVDLETLFSAPIKDNLSYSQSAFIKASKLLRNSVLSVGLLPTKMKLGEKNAASIGVLDIPQSYEVLTPSLTNLGSSKMKINMLKKTIQTEQRSFLFEDKLQTPINFVSFIKDGFIEIYQWIANNRGDFEKCIIDLFDECKIRIVLKPTMIYSQLITAANHPDFLTRDIHRRIVFSRVGLLTEDEKVAKSEIYDLERNNIPYFFTSFNENNLYTFSKTFKNVLCDSPKEHFCKKIRLFNNDDLKRQLKFIDDSFFKKEVENELTPLNQGGYTTNPINQKDSSNYKKMAVRIGDLLTNQAIFGENEKNQSEVVWLDTSVANMDIEDWTPEVTSFDLYNGLSGLVIFYMNLEKVSENSDNKLIIKTIIRMLKTHILSAFNKRVSNQTGMMTGLSGLFFTIFEYSKMYNSDEEEKFLEKEIVKLRSIIPENNPIDYISGNVGALALMIKIIKNTTNKNLENECRILAEIIILDFKKKKDSLFKLDNSKAVPIYSGFSHGLSGLINYLYEYYKLTNKKYVYQLFKECLDYQRLNFWCSIEKDWFVSDREQKFAYGWCHGSPGILIEKINLKHLGYHDDQLEKEITYAVNNLIKNLGTNISLCHGDLGNLLILNRYAQLEENEKIKLIVKNSINSIYEFIDVNMKNENRLVFKNFKGLLLGIAGIGDFMLKSYVGDTKQDLIEYLW